jgi:hypothetical protein
MVGLCYLLLTGLVLLENSGVLISLSLLSLLVGAFFAFVSFGLSCIILRVIVNKLAD